MSRDDHFSGPTTQRPELQGLPTVLLVDDNPLLRNVLQGLLIKHGYNVLEAENGEAALSVLKEQSVDLIICDVMMPKMGGFELHEQLRKVPTSSHVPFVFLSARDREEDVRHGKEVGAEDYLCKPIEPKNLLAVVKGKLARWRDLESQSNVRYSGYQKRVIQTLSHEFRTPLVAINTGMELLLNHRDALGAEKAKRLLEAVQRGGVRLEQLVGDFMVLQQLEAGVFKRTFAASAEVLSVAQLMHRHSRIREEQLAADGFSVARIDESGGAHVACLESALVDALDRLVSNAVKFSQDRKEIEIHSRVAAGEVWFDVKDRGMGLDLSQIREAMEPFGQINRAKYEQQGGGLGLSIAAWYAKIHGGRLEFKNRDGGGAIVSIVLPAAVIAEQQKVPAGFVEPS
jgi:two-component system sensor histidine kinase/response regulator